MKKVILSLLFAWFSLPLFAYTLELREVDIQFEHPVSTIHPKEGRVDDYLEFAEGRLYLVDGEFFGILWKYSEYGTYEDRLYNADWYGFISYPPTLSRIVIPAITIEDNELHLIDGERNTFKTAVISERHTPVIQEIDTMEIVRDGSLWSYVTTERTPEDVEVNLNLDDELITVSFIDEQGRDNTLTGYIQ